MLTRWLTFTALIAGSANPERAAITVTSTCRVKGYLEAELTLKCGDGKNTGVVQYWHTPFGDLQTPGSHSKLNPVFMHHDGSLVIPTTSSVHSGLYYCLLQHTEGITLWSYELHVNHETQKNQEHSKYEQASSCDASRLRRDVGSDTGRQAVISDGQFAGAVAASVLLTFVLGFSAGALSRTHVVRCIGAVTKRLESPQRQCQTLMPDHGSQVSMITLTPMYDNQAFETEQVETTISSTASSPPAKPQRSFRTKREDKQETTAYLERCDYVEKETRVEGLVVGRSLEERNEVYDGEAKEKIKFYLSEDGEGQTETDENQFSEEGEETGTRESTEETQEWREEKEVEEEDKQENINKEGGKGNKKNEEVGGIEETGGDVKRVEEEGWREDKEAENECGGEDRASDICSRDETGSKKEDDVKSGIVEGEPVSSPPLMCRRSRVIRLYHYDDDGQRYCHLPEPVPDETGPTPRPRHHSVSLTRLSTIMAAASAGPLNAEDSPHFQMEI